MKTPSCTSSGRRKGIAEVVGALLLIIVVVIAVATLSIFLSRAQVNAENRQNYLTEVQNDELQFTNAQFAPNSPNVQWELDGNASQLGIQNPPRYYVSMISDSVVDLNQNGTTALTSASLYTLLSKNLVLGNFSEISKGTPVSYHSKQGRIVFHVGASNANFTFEPASWESLTLTIRNLNTIESGVTQIEVGDVWMRNWTWITQANTSLGMFSPVAPLSIPAKSSVNVFVNLSVPGASFTKNSSLTVKVISTFGNTFSTTYSTPVPVARASTASENYLITNRDVITLDGSQSYSAADTIQEYVWAVSIPYVNGNGAQNCVANAFQNSTYYITAFVTGETIQYTPESLFPSGLNSDCIDGPVQATLTVVDDLGFMSSSNYLILPQDQSISPPANLNLISAKCGPSMTNATTVQVNNIFGQPSPNVAVIAFGSGGVTVTGSTEVTTGPAGQATFTYACPSAGYLQVTAGSLPPLSVTVP